MTSTKVFSEHFPEARRTLFRIYKQIQLRSVKAVYPQHAACRPASDGTCSGHGHLIVLLMNDDVYMYAVNNVVCMAVVQAHYNNGRAHPHFERYTHGYSEWLEAERAKESQLVLEHVIAKVGQQKVLRITVRGDAVPEMVVFLDSQEELCLNVSYASAYAVHKHFFPDNKPHFAKLYF